MKHHEIGENDNELKQQHKLEEHEKDLANEQISYRNYTCPYDVFFNVIAHLSK